MCSYCVLLVFVGYGFLVYKALLIKPFVFICWHCVLRSFFVFVHVLPLLLNFDRRFDHRFSISLSRRFDHRFISLSRVLHLRVPAAKGIRPSRPRTSRVLTESIASLFALLASLPCLPGARSLNLFDLFPRTADPHTLHSRVCSAHGIGRQRLIMKPKGPKRPPSAYNIFFSRESKRLKRRENALVRYRTLFSQGKSQPKLNCTQATESKWSKEREAKSFVPYFDLVREEKLQEYCTRKKLFLAETASI